LSTVRRAGADPLIVQRVARLKDLRCNEPFLARVIGNHRDAWLQHHDEVQGRVWVVRRSEATAAPHQAKIEAFTSLCPHLGCALQISPARDQFICPCHKGAFDLSGQPVPSEKLGYKNPAPRAMDTVDCRVVQDAVTKEWWVEVQYGPFTQALGAKVAKT